MNYPEVIARALDYGGVLLLAVLIVWRIEVRLASVERKIGELCALLRAYLAARREA